jgi:hypothetical protein
METMEIDIAKAQDEEDINLIILICLDIEQRLVRAIPMLPTRRAPWVYTQHQWSLDNEPDENARRLYRYQPTLEQPS